MKKILIVDDSYAARMYLEKMLEEFACTVIHAEDGEDGLSKIESHQPDVMLIDLLMPKMTGIEVLELLQGRCDAPKVIVISADIQAPTKQKCQDLGATAFIAKPVMKDELHLELQKLLIS